MKNVISVDSLIDTCLHPERNGLLLKEQVAEGASYEWLVKRELKSQLHSLLISKLPEKDYMCRNSPDYKRAVEDMRKSIDELFRSGDES